MSKTAAIYFQIPKTLEADAVKRRIAVLAAEQGRSQGEIVLEALRVYLEAQKRSNIGDTKATKNTIFF